uniref:Zyg-1-like serine/threonine protein kinase n=1 Tax=Heterorhabditis bacteriophora TaxID=37862 RepID=A0A1I7XSN4_HETBA
MLYRRMTAGEDVPLAAPSLLDLSAGVLSRKIQLQNSYKSIDLQKEPVGEVLRAWCDSSRLPLSHLDLSGAELSDSLLADLLHAHHHSITQLNLSNVKGISDETNTLLDERNATFPLLHSLRMTSMELLSRPPPRRKLGVAGMDTRNVPVLGEEDLEGAGGLDQMRESRGGPSHPNLAIQQAAYDDGCSSSTLSLTAVSEKEWIEEEEQDPPVFTSRCPAVTSLALPKTRRFPEDEETSVNDLLGRVFEPLKELSALDLSYWTRPDMIQGNVRSDIVGLRFLERPLIYLGLFNCDNASHFGEIPALHISGDANEDQVIMALQMYKDRAGLLQSVLNESYQLYRFGNSNPLVRHTEALHLVLGAMQNHLEDSTLQIAGSASLFYIIRKVSMNRDTKKQVVSALLSGINRLCHSFYSII